MSETHNCGSCVSMRKTDGYCRRTGKYVNALSSESCWLPKEGAREEAQRNLPKVGPQEVPPTRFGVGGSYLVPDGTKYCPGCKMVLPLESFGKSRATADGYASYCKPCMNEMQRKIRTERIKEKEEIMERIAKKEPAPKKEPKRRRKEPAMDFRSLAALLIYSSGKASSMHEAISRADTLIERLKDEQGRNS